MKRDWVLAATGLTDVPATGTIAGMVEKDPRSLLSAMRSCEFFENLDEETLLLIRPAARRVHQPKNTVVFNEGEECRGFYIVESGAIKLYKESSDAKEHVLHIAMAGDPFGEAALFLGTGYPATAAAVGAYPAAERGVPAAPDGAARHQFPIAGGNGDVGAQAGFEHRSSDAQGCKLAVRGFSSRQSA